MRNTTKTFSALLTGALILSPFAVTAFAAEGKTLNITASSNFSPSVTQSIDAATKQITATWWLQDAEDSMVNIQGVLTYDNTKLRVDMTDGVNRTYDVSSDEYTENILCITNGQSTVVNYQPKTLPSNANAGIRFNATQSSGFSMGTATERVPFFSVTFNPVDNAEGDTEIHLEIDFMAVRDDNDTTYHKLIHHAEIVDTDADFLPDEAAAIYAGPFDPNYTPAEPTTAEPTTIPPTTVAPTTIAPTTVAPTTVAPTTIAPTTVAPTTIAPTTIAPTTIAPTTVAPTTIAPTTIAPTTIAPTTIAPTTIQQLLPQQLLLQQLLLRPSLRRQSLLRPNPYPPIFWVMSTTTARLMFPTLHWFRCMPRKSSPSTNFIFLPVTSTRTALRISRT